MTGSVSYPLGFSVRNLAVGVICGLMALVTGIGYASLLFAGPLHPFLPVGIGITLFSSVMLAAVTSFSSSVKHVIAAPQSPAVVALAVPIQAAVVAMAGASPHSIIVNTLVAVALYTIVAGGVLWAMGALRLGRFVRYVPFPVTGGFIAGTGWLILLGGIGVVIGKPVSVEALMAPATLPKEGVVLGLLLVMLLFHRWLSGGLATPAVILGALIAFNVVVFAAGIPNSALRADGWLTPLAGAGLWPAIAPADLSAADPGIIWSMMSGLPSMLAVSVLVLLLNMGALEIATHSDIDLNRELRSAGYANVLSGLGAGPPGFHSISLTMLGYRIGGSGMLMGLSAAAICLAALFLGDRVMDLIPTPILGALLIWVGGSLAFEWLVLPARRVPPFEYLTILLIFAVVVFIGLGWGAFVGMIAAAVLFAVEYAGIDSVRHVLTGKDYQSSLQQSDARREALRRHGDAILIMRLQGYLFFGSAERLRRRIQGRLASDEVRYLVIDFRRVSGLDSSAVLSFIRLAQLTERNGFELYLTDLNQTMRDALTRGGPQLADGAHVHLDGEFDEALEQCESALLASIDPGVVHARAWPIADRLKQIVPEPDLLRALLSGFTRLELPVGGRLVEEGTPAGDMFLIEEGRASVVISGEHGRPVRLAALGPGALVGEIAFYLGKPRTASVVADEPVVAWQLNRQKLDQLEADQPTLAAHFHKALASMLADRLSATDRLVHFLNN